MQWERTRALSLCRHRRGGEEAVRGVRARVVSCAASENALRRARSRLPHGLVVPPQGLKGSDADAAAA